MTPRSVPDILIEMSLHVILDDRPARRRWGNWERRLAEACATFLLFLVLDLTGVTAWIWTRRHVESYCQTCGLLRELDSESWFGSRTAWKVRTRATAFQRLYRRHVSPHCVHAWAAVLSSCRSLSAISIGHGRHLPSVLSDDLDLEPIERLGNRGRIAAVLAAFDIQSDVASAVESSDRHDALIVVIAELLEVKTPVEEERWWRRNRDLFRPIPAPSGAR